MLRKLVILGIFAGGTAAIPSVFQSNPELLNQLLGRSASEKTTNLRSSPDAVGQASQQPLGRKVLIKADATGHFRSPFKINGRQVDALIDTGATLVALNTSTARRVGLSISPSDFTQQVSTANGPVKVAVVRLSSLQVGKIALENIDAVVIDDKALNTNLIGMSFLSRLGKYAVEDGALLMVQ
ncbi:retropepsin-like aspartic protease family protein [Mesorhizobium retamae]|uniref:TIGR02281 family clan AA aspartic protease n=1 Tax=Mesorhizobium retamae TaxID=2912854 RepID=A0ABS9QBQ7_9HYPH|nr:TIGR02281 family clan AA aspartic protease [Mesorhizobium sp. IRAMC:0171]MCG7504840.1 TIGR02281 family clan AA aspartic protease [Mesorhizobium sp. IRAMC:0171]